MLQATYSCSFLTALSYGTEKLPSLRVKEAAKAFAINSTVYYVIRSLMLPKRTHSCGTAATVNFHLLFLNPLKAVKHPV